MQAKQARRTISMAESVTYFVISLVINSLGNVLTLISSDHVHPSFLGSAYWTAADADLGHAFLGNNSWVLFWETTPGCSSGPSSASAC